MELKE